MDLLRQLLDALGQFRTGIRDAWDRLTLSARVNITLAGVATTIVILTLVFMSGGTQYVELYQGMDLQDASEIIVFLREEGYPFKLRDQNRTIMVPADAVSNIRMALTDGDLVPRSQGGVPGFELFNKQDLLTNRWLQDVNYMRAVQGELQRQLNEFDFITSSRVFISQAAEQLFVQEQQPSEAAVTLSVTRPLTKLEVKAILATVSSFGGPNLHPGNITLTTTDGQVLHLPAADEFASLANSRLELRTDYERERENKVRAAFDQMQKKAIVRVAASMNWDQVRINERTVSEGAEVSTWNEEMTTTTEELPPEGAPGAGANIPVGMASGPGSVRSSTTEESVIVNNDPSTRETETVRPGGDVESYTATAFVEGDYRTVTDDEGNETVEYVPLTEEQVAMYREFIAKTVGAGLQASDVGVFDYPAAAVTTAAMGPAAAAPFWQQRRSHVIALQLGIILVAFLALRYVLKKVIIPPPGEVVEEEIGPEEAGPTTEELHRQEVITSVEDLARTQPDAVAALLRAWMLGEE